MSTAETAPARGTTAIDRQALLRLARLYGVQTSYEDVAKQRREASPEALFRVLQVLGAPLERFEDAGDALRQRQRDRWRQVIEPVLVGWDGLLRPISLRLREDQASQAFQCEIIQEDGQRRTYSGQLADLPTRRMRQLDGTHYLVKRLFSDSPRPLAGEGPGVRAGSGEKASQPLGVPDPLPYGYHRLTLELSGGQVGQSTLISAPRVAWSLPADKQHAWGVFLPLYALHRKTSWGAGDFTDLEALVDFVGSRGGHLVASLPLLATQWELTNNASPYSPSSRLFWNEFYLDPTRVPESNQCVKAQTLLESPQAQADLAAMRREPLVDYPRQMKWKRAVLEALAECFFDRPEDHRRTFEAYCRETPEVESFARFRAAGQRQGKPWPEWPERLRDGAIEPGDYDEAIYRYHLYTQWQVEHQLGLLVAKARQRELLWYLDFPLGVNGAGYDTWRWRDVFAWGAAGGAPPDTFFTKGQNWGFPPLDPGRLREQGYRYLIMALERHLAYARVLRIDHAMSLERLYWVPDGMDAKDGVYVRYPTDELFALLTLESHRHNAWIVGENLGTVSDALNEALDRHRVAGMYVAQLEVRPDADPPLRQVPSTTVASLNTHDTPQFAAFWTGLDIDNSVDLGLVSPEEASRQRDERAAVRRNLLQFLEEHGFIDHKTLDPEDVQEAMLAFLASSDAPVVLVNLEDLWQEMEPQNTPGTFNERPNWRRKARYSLEEFRDLSIVDRVLDRVAACRRRTGG